MNEPCPKFDIRPYVKDECLEDILLVTNLKPDEESLILRSLTNPDNQYYMTEEHFNKYLK